MAAAGTLDAATLEFVAGCRTATLATIAPSGLPRLVPICFVIGRSTEREPVTIVSPLDDKPKSSDDPRRLARVRDIVARPQVSLLVERWSEDWTQLGWVRLDCTASVIDPDHAGRHATAVEALREKYPQYRNHRLEERPMLRFRVERVVTWGRFG